MLSLYFVYLDLGLDTRVFVCICLLATRGDSSASLVYSSTHTLSHLLAATLATIGANGQQRLGHDLVLGLAGGNDACTPPGAVGFEFATGGMAVRTDVAWGLFVVS